MTDIRSNLDLATKAAYERANGRDEITGKLCENLNAHHKLPRSRYPDRECDVDNIIVIDADIHHGFVHNSDRSFLEGLSENQIKAYEELHELTGGVRSPYWNGFMIPREELKYGLRTSDESYKKVQGKGYRDSNKEKEKARHKAYNDSHRVEVRARNTACYYSHKEKRKASLKVYHELHKEERNARSKAFTARDMAVRHYYGFKVREWRALPKSTRALMRVEFDLTAPKQTTLF